MKALLFLLGFLPWLTYSAVVVVPLEVSPSNSWLRLNLTVLNSTNTQSSPLAGTVLLGLEFEPELSRVSLRDLQLRAVDDSEFHNGLGFWGALDVSTRDVEILHGDPGDHRPWDPIVGGRVIFRNVPNRLSGAAEYVATGLVCFSLLSSGRPCQDTVRLEDQPTTPWDDLSAEVTVVSNRLFFHGQFDFGPLTVAGTADFPVRLRGQAELHASGTIPGCLWIERLGDLHGLAWPGTLSGYRLQRTASLAVPVEWEPAPEEPRLEGGVWRAVLPTEGNSWFYRLVTE